MNELIDRREALRKTAMFMGAAVSASALSGILYGCKATPDLNYKPVFFTEDQARLVSELSNVIIPKTDTPGAKEVGVPNFIDQILKECHSKEDQDRFLAGLSAFDEDAKKIYGDRFIYCKPEDQLAFVKQTNAAAVKEKNENLSDKNSFFYKTKELTMLGFFTSEPGATQVLQYEVVPGAYHGCVPLSEAGNSKTWAS
jgi:gluconate 2-dehydrogenase gamma chain